MDGADSVTMRLDRLERENRRLKRWGAAGLLCLLAFMVMGQAAGRPRVLQAERFVVVDSLGNKRAELATGKNVTSLEFWDAAGQRRAAFGFDLGPYFFLGGEETHNGVSYPQVRLDVTGPFGAIRVAHRDGTRVYLGTDKIGWGTLKLMTSREKLGAVLRANGVESSLFLSDGDGKLRIGLAAQTDLSALIIQDNSEKPVIDLTAGTTRPPLLQFSDRNHKTRAFLGLTHTVVPQVQPGQRPIEAPTLKFFDEGGQETSVPVSTSLGAQTWVLWRQGLLFISNQMRQVTVALSAWPTRADCESVRAQAVATEKKQQPVQGAGFLYVCLPDTVKLPGQP